MRIITGKARGMKLRTLEGLATRPTSEAAKEGIFSAIQFELHDRRVLDLFGGSGQLALEALSRGAEFAVINDASREAANIIKEKYGVKEVVTGYVGPVIGAHTGPGVLVVFYMGNNR